jgi:hypothetical protein
VNKPRGAARLKARMDAWIDYVEQPQSLVEAGAHSENRPSGDRSEGERYLEVGPEIDHAGGAEPGRSQSAGLATPINGVGNGDCSGQVVEKYPRDGPGQHARPRVSLGRSRNSHAFASRNNGKREARPPFVGDPRRGAVDPRFGGVSGESRTGSRQTFLLLIVGLLVAGSSALIALWFIH